MRWIAMILAVVLMGAGPATQPSTRPSVESDLRRIIAGLQVQIVTLKSENAELKARLSAAPQISQAPATQPVVVPSNPFKEWESLKVGMSMQDVKKTLPGWNSHLNSKSVDGDVWIWSYNETNRFSSTTAEVSTTFQEGKVAEFEKMPGSYRQFR